MINLFGITIDTVYLISLVVFAVSLVAIVLCIVVLCKLRNMKRAYTKFMSGKDAESLEPLILKKFEEIDTLKTLSDKNSNHIKEILDRLQFVYQKVGIVKYDAFNEMGGKLSFSLAMLDDRKNGYIINSMHSREGCYTYIKEIVNGQSYIDLGEEEQQALNQALVGQGDMDLGDFNNKLK